MNKINCNKRRVLLGVALCAVLAVFIASKAADAQVSATTQQARVLQRAVILSDVYDKTVSLEVKLASMEERLIRIENKLNALSKGLEVLPNENKLDALSKDMEVVLRVLKRIDPQNQR